MRSQKLAKAISNNFSFHNDVLLLGNNVSIFQSVSGNIGPFLLYLNSIKPKQSKQTFVFAGPIKYVLRITNNKEFILYDECICQSHFNTQFDIANFEYQPVPTYIINHSNKTRLN